MTPNDFHTDTVLELAQPGGYRVEVSDRWSVGPGANGGDLAGLLAKGLMTATDRNDLRSLTVHCLAPATPGPAELQTGVLRQGRSATIIDANLSRGASLIAVGRGVLAAKRESPSWNVRTAPQFPDPDTLDREEWPDPQMIRSRYDTRYVEGGFPAIRGPKAEVSGWIRPADHSPIDLALLVAMCDAWPPPLLMLDGPSLMARTIDLTVHLFDVLETPHDGWVAMTNRSTISVDGYVDTETEAWTDDGRLLAQGRQLSATMPWDPPV